MTWLIIPVVAVFLAYRQTVITRSGALTANSIFVYLQLLMAVGSLTLLDADVPADVLYSKILVYTFIVYLAASALWTFVLPAPPPRDVRQDPIVRTPSSIFWLMMCFSASLVVGYFITVGQSAFVQGLQVQFGGNEADVTQLRLDAYAGSRYFAPGYINQFKNALLPSLVLIALTYWTKAGVLKKRRLPAVCFSALAVFGLLGTGQRGAFIIFAFTTVVYLYLLNHGRLPRVVIVVVLSVLGLALLSTIALGRTTGDLPPNAPVSQQASVAFIELSDRVFLANQGSGVFGFRYIASYTQVQDGQEWVKSMTGILPGRGGSDLVNRIFAYRYGSDRGSSPPSIWGSIYHNFGIAGIATSPLVLGLLLAGISRLGTRSRRYDSMELMGIAGVFTVTGFWVAGSPLFLFNNGIMVYTLLWLLGRHARLKLAGESGATERAASTTRGQRPRRPVKSR